MRKSHLIVLGIAGLVLVLGGAYAAHRNDAVKACLKNMNGTKQSLCWAADLTKALDAHGLGGAFDRFSSLYREYPEFSANCHDVGHVLGNAAYQAYEKDPTIVIARSETAYCGYGFYHGFVEAMFADQGPAQYERAYTYCESLKTNTSLPGRDAANTASAACFHGIGHALFDSVDSKFWGDDRHMATLVLGECEVVSADNAERRWCASGVFNSMVNAYQSHAYQLSFEKPDPTAICAMQKSLYQEVCYKEVDTQYLNNQKFSFADGVAFIRAHRTSPTDEVMMTYIDNIVRHATPPQTPAEAYALCQVFKDDSADTEACIDGSLYSFSAGGEPRQEYKVMFAFCALFDATDRADCFTRAGVLLETLYSPESVTASCNALPAPDATACKAQL